VASSFADCSRIQIQIESNFEPSDAVWDGIRQKFWTVSDEGELASMNFDGTDITYWIIPKAKDLEGLVQIAGREQYIYLQRESSKTLLEFDVESGVVVRDYDLGGIGDFEAVVWVLTSQPSNSVLYSGNQKKGKISVNSIDFETGVTTFVEIFTLPAPNPGDLSALHYEIDSALQIERLTALYDTSKLMVLYVRSLGELSNLAWRATKQWHMPDRGIEGITWADVGGARYFFICVDSPKDHEPRVRTVFRYTSGFEDVCFGAELIGES